MAQKNGPVSPDRNTEPGSENQPRGVDDLEDRRKSLDAALAARRERSGEVPRGRNTDGVAGMASGLKLSSEFIAGILVGAGLGYLIDRIAGTSPWGLIVFLLLGFAAGVLNVLRSVGVVAEPDAEMRPGDKPDRKDK